MNNKIALALSSAVLLSTSIISTPVQADAIGLYIGGQVWSSGASGLVGDQNQLIDLNLDTKQQGSFFIAIEHPLPFIPNFKVSSSTLDTKGGTTLAVDFTFGGTTFPSGSTARTDFKTDFIDYTAYYEVFDNDGVSFDFGLTIRDINADVTVVGATATTPPVSSTGKVNASAYIPMVYVAANIGIPSTDFNLFGEANFLSISGQTLYDYQLGVSYELVDNLAVDVNLTLGYWDMKSELDNVDKLSTNLEFKGAFAGAVVHF